MSVIKKLTLSDELARLVDQARGPLSFQDFALQALAAACTEPPLVAELRAEIERLHATIRIVATGATATPSAPAVPLDERLGW
jgi:hypothetical protein